MFNQVLANSRYDLPNPVVDRYFELAFDYAVGYLRDGDASRAGALDPVGELNLTLSKKVRRRAMSDHTADHPEVLEEMADAFFSFPEGALEYWPQVEDPQFAQGISLTVGAAGKTLPAPPAV